MRPCCPNESLIHLEGRKPNVSALGIRHVEKLPLRLAVVDRRTVVSLHGGDVQRRICDRQRRGYCSVNLQRKRRNQGQEHAVAYLPDAPGRNHFAWERIASTIRSSTLHRRYYGLATLPLLLGLLIVLNLVLLFWVFLHQWSVSSQAAVIKGLVD